MRAAIGVAEFGGGAMKTIIAIDPGKSGGIAAWSNPESPSMVSLIPMPATDGDVAETIKSNTWNWIVDRSYGDDCVVVIEKVGGYIPRKGKKNGGGQPGSSMFKFGYGTGFLHGVCMALGLPIVEVRPQEWQKRFSLGTKGNLTTSEWKNKLKSEAQRRFPNLDITLKTADALLILEWYRATRGGGQ